jgi:hypothetical protein
VSVVGREMLAEITAKVAGNHGVSNRRTAESLISERLFAQYLQITLPSTESAMRRIVILFQVPGRVSHVASTAGNPQPLVGP